MNIENEFLELSKINDKLNDLITRCEELTIKLEEIGNE